MSCKKFQGIKENEFIDLININLMNNKIDNYMINVLNDIYYNGYDWKTVINKYNIPKRTLQYKIKRLGFQSYLHLRKGNILIKINNGQSIDKAFKRTKDKHYKERKEITVKRRFNILKRDNFRCCYCGLKGYETKLHIDHIIPLSKGGNSNNSNLQVLCYKCNLGKSNS